MPTQLLGTGSADFASATANTATTSFLIPRTLLPEVINAVRKKLVLRGLAARVFGPAAIPGRTLVLPLQAEITANNELDGPQVAEGAEIPITQTEFTSLTLTPVKYGARIGVTKEMMEDGIIDLLSYHAELAGYEFADNEEALIVAALNTASAAAGNNVANANATLPITDITEAMQNLEANNYRPSHLICGVEVVNDLRNIDTFVEADKSGMNDPSKSLVGVIYGMKVVVSNNVTATLAYMIDANHAFVIAEKRPLTVERYSDVARDSGFVVITQRLAVSGLRNNATSEITTT
jgi:HK97 family phage major capsid protein|tara:strand:- start:1980 stop:2858 length:879 start_codon:yes stop_codon:yes gene_type:complete